MNNTFSTNHKPGVASAFLAKMFARTEGDIFICSYANLRAEAKKFPPRDITTRDPAEIENFIRKYDETGRAVYFAVNTMKGNERGKEHVAAINVLHVDIDFHGIAEDENAIRAALAKLKLEPSAVVSSGHGLHCYWLLTTPLGPEHIKRVEELLKKLAAMLAGDTSAAEIARVLRLPGSHNSKGGERLDVTVVEELTTWKTYDIGDLETWLNGAKPVLTYVKTDRTTAAVEELKKNCYQVFCDEMRAEHGGFDAVEQLRKMEFHDTKGNGIDDTHAKIVGAMVADGKSTIDDALRILRGPTKRAFELGRLSGDGQWSEKEFAAGVKRKFRYFMKLDAKKEKAEAMLDKTAPAKHDFDDGLPDEKTPKADPFDPFNETLAPDLPRGALPELIENVAFDEGRVMGVDPGVIAMSMLAMCAGIIPDQLRLKVKRATTDGWHQRACIWVGVVGTASTKKSAGMAETKRIVKKFDDVMAINYSNAMEQYKADKAAKLEDAEPPIEKRILIQNITPEKISTLQTLNPNGLLYAVDELVVVFGNLDRYGNKGGGAGRSSRGALLSAYDGIVETVDREGRTAAKGEGGGISIIGGIQPGVISKLVEEGSQNDGLVNRFNFVFAKTIGEGVDEEIDHPFAEYDDLIEALHKHMPLAGGADFRFSDTAMEFKNRSFKEINRMIRKADEDGDAQLVSHLGKWENMFVRYCILFHVIDNWRDKHPRAVSQETVLRVDRLMNDYLIPHSIAFYKALGSDEEIGQLKRACKHILVNNMRTVTVRELQKALGRHKGITARDMEKVGSKLQTWDWLVRIPGKRNQSNSIRWSVHDEVFIKLAKMIPGFKAEKEATQTKMKADFKVRRDNPKEPKK